MEENPSARKEVQLGMVKRGGEREEAGVMW